MEVADKRRRSDHKQMIRLVFQQRTGPLRIAPKLGKRPTGRGKKRDPPRNRRRRVVDGTKRQKGGGEKEPKKGKEKVPKPESQKRILHGLT